MAPPDYWLTSPSERLPGRLRHASCRGRTASPGRGRDTGPMTSQAGRRGAAARAGQPLRPGLPDDAVAALGPDEADAFLTRADVALLDIHEPLAFLYGE